MNRVLVLAVAVVGSGCGGSVVFEDDRGGAGGNGGEGPSTSVVGTAIASSAASTSATSSTSATTTAQVSSASVSTGIPALCSSHAECPGALCFFPTGECVPACTAAACDSCGPGLVCEACATTSTPGSNDCVAACLPPAAGRCDDDDRCPAGGVCVHHLGICAPPCDDPVCADPNMYCEPCATASSCGDADCVGACFPLDG